MRKQKDNAGTVVEFCVDFWRHSTGTVYNGLQVQYYTGIVVLLYVQTTMASGLLSLRILMVESSDGCPKPKSTPKVLEAARDRRGKRNRERQRPWNAPPQPGKIIIFPFATSAFSLLVVVFFSSNTHSNTTNTFIMETAYMGSGTEVDKVRTTKREGCSPSKDLSKKWQSRSLTHMVGIFFVSLVFFLFS